jgi:hypothetical protein
VDLYVPSGEAILFSAASKSLFEMILIDLMNLL